MSGKKHVFACTVGLLIAIGLLALLQMSFFRAYLESFLRAPDGLGILLSIALMVVFCILPIPAEVAMIENIRVQGMWIGTLCNWFGAIAGALILFFLTRFIRARLGGAIPVKYLFLHKPGLTRWDRNMLLLSTRILPIPAKLVDISAGVFSSITWQDFFWTTALGVLPYQVLAVFVYQGIKTSSTPWIFGIFALLSILGWFAWRYSRFKKLKSE